MGGGRILRNWKCCRTFVGQGCCAARGAAPSSAASRMRLAERELLSGSALEAGRSDLTEQFACPFEIGASFFHIAVQTAEMTVLEIRVCLDLRIPARTADLQCFLEKRNTIRITAQAEDLPQTRVDFGQCTR